MSSSASTPKERGNAAFSAGRFEEAAQHFSEGIELDPNNHVLFSNRSACYASLKQFDQALDDAERVVAIKADWAKGYSRKGAALHGLGRLPDAIEAYEAGLKLDPNNQQMKQSIEELKDQLEFGAGGGPGGNPFGDRQIFTEDVWPKLAMHPSTRGFMGQPDFVQKIKEIIANPSKLQMHMGDQRVLQAFAVAMGLNLQMPGAGEAADQFPSSSSPPAQASAASAAPASTQPSPASAAGSKTQSAPQPPKAETEEEMQHRRAEEVKEEGNTFYKRREFDQAIAKYDEALALWPDNISFLNNKATALSEAGRYEECVALCEDTIEKGRAQRADFKLVARTFARMGGALAKMNRFDEAIRALEKSLAEHRTSEVVNRLHETERLKREFEAQAYLNPEIAVQEKERGNALFKEGKFADALDAYSEAIKRNPDEPAYWSNRSACYTKLARFDLALKDAEKCLELNPSFVKGFVRKGNAHFGLKEYHKALEAFDSGMKLDPAQPELREGAVRVSSALAREQSSGQVDPERAARAMADPEIQAILSDPSFQQILKSMQENPGLAAEFMSKPEIAAKVRKLIAAGILQTR